MEYSTLFRILLAHSSFDENLALISNIAVDTHVRMAVWTRVLVFPGCPRQSRVIRNYGKP